MLRLPTVHARNTLLLNCVMIGSLRLLYKESTPFYRAVIQSMLVYLTCSSFTSMVEHSERELFAELTGRKQAEETKTSFIAYIMHEIRNPLQASMLIVHELINTIQTATTQQRALGTDNKGIDGDELLSLMNVVESQLRGVAQVG
jgi:signal transduction histidine kinase